MKLVVIALALTCSLATARVPTRVPTRVSPSNINIRVVNKCGREITLYKSGWSLNYDNNFEFRLDSNGGGGVDAVTLQSGKQRDLIKWYHEKESNYFGFWDNVLVYENKKQCPKYTYREIVEKPSPCDDKPPNIGFVSVMPGHEYHLCNW